MSGRLALAQNDSEHGDIKRSPPVQRGKCQSDERSSAERDLYVAQLVNVAGFGSLNSPPLALPARTARAPVARPFLVLTVAPTAAGVI